MRSLLRYCCFFVLLGITACGSRPDLPEVSEVPVEQAVFLNEGMASYYGARHHGRKTASGEPFNKNALTAAHKTLPFGSRVRVTNLRTQRAVVVTINDRGPYAKRRVIDLSEQAAREIGMLRAGVAPVKLELLQ